MTFVFYPIIAIDIPRRAPIKFCRTDEHLSSLPGGDKSLSSGTSYTHLPQFSQKGSALAKLSRIRQSSIICMFAILPLLPSGLGRGQERQDVDDLLKSLRSQDVGARERAILDLAASGKSAAPKLSAVLVDGDPDVRRGAAYALGEIRPDDRETILQLANLLSDPNRAVRVEAAHALGKIGQAAAPAVPHLLKALKDKDPLVRRMAAQSLGEIGADPPQVIQELMVLRSDADPEVRRAAINAIEKFDPGDALPFLTRVIEQLKDQDADSREAAARIVGSIGYDAGPATNELTPLLKDKEFRVRLAAAQALGKIGPRAANSVPALANALGDSEYPVRAHAAKALGEIGAASKEAVPRLTMLLKDPDRDVRTFAAKALAQIASELARARDINAIDDLKSAVEALPLTPDSDLARHREEISKEIQTLEAIRSEQTLWQRLRNYAGNNPIKFSIMAFCVLLIGSTLALFQFSPIRLLRLNESLTGIGDFTVSLKGVTKTVSLRHLLFFGLFHYRPRLLDAWVSHNAVQARKAFARKKIVAEREIYVPLPLALDGKEIQTLRADDLQQLFSDKLACLLILGEGGAGKTSLACLLGKWAMDDKQGGRLCTDHMMLPVIIKDDIPLGPEAGEERFLDEIGNQVKGIINEDRAPSRGLLKGLLRRRRIVLLVDGHSEMRDELYKVIMGNIQGVPANALVFTGRADKVPSSLTGSTIKPLGISKDKLLDFIVPYLGARGKRGLLTDDQVNEGAHHLLEIVGGRDITPLLAKLYIELLIERQEKSPSKELPRNIPELMIGYVRAIYEQSAPFPEGPSAVIEAAKLIAWESVKRTYSPVPVKRVNAQRVLGRGENSEGLLNYLEAQLKIIQPTGSDQSRVRFVFEPLAEYLAGVYCVNKYGTDEERWQDFFKGARVQKGAPESIREFLSAVKDCYVAACLHDVGTSDPVLVELEKLTAKPPMT